MVHDCAYLILAPQAAQTVTRWQPPGGCTGKSTRMQAAACHSWNAPMTHASQPHKDSTTGATIAPS